MNSETTFCEECREVVSFSTKENKAIRSFKGEEVEFLEKTASCDKCGNGIFVAEHQDSNLTAFYDAYRRKNDIISLEHIREIPVKYAIGKRPLSLLLGWGEISFTRYCDGDLPTKQYSDTLKRIYAEPAYYLSVLEDKKDMIKPSAYKKSKLAVQTLLGDTSPIFTDIIASTNKYKQMILNAVKYGADSDGRITKTKLAKLVYLSDFTWYYLKSSPMSGMTYIKLPHGPVSDVYFRALDELEEDGTIIREHKGKAFLYSLVEKEVSANTLVEDELNLIKKIGNTWRNKSTDDIVSFTHEQLPWQSCRFGEIIPFGLIKQEKPEKVYGEIQL